MSFQPRCPVAQEVGPSRFEHDVLALRPTLCAFAQRLSRQEPDTEDLVQETVLRALAARDQFLASTNLKAWLFTIMRNSFNSRWRRALRETIPGSEAIEARSVTPDTQTTDIWAREAIDRLLHDLSPAHREILIPVLDLSYEDAAKACGCSMGTVKSRLNRARAALAVRAAVTEGHPA